MAGDLIVRNFQPPDAKELTAILDESSQAAPWGPGAAEELAGTKSAVMRVSESEGRASGFIIARQVADEAEILNLAVRRTERRQGQATALLQSALRTFRQSGVTRVFLEVRECNAPAIALYEKHGFRQIGRRRSYYRNPDEDALLFELKLTG